MVCGISGVFYKKFVLAMMFGVQSISTDYTILGGILSSSESFPVYHSKITL